MSRPKSAVPRKWRSYEVCEVSLSSGALKRPFSEALAGGSGGLPTQALTKMRMVQEHGWPTAKFQLKDRRGRNLIAAKGDGIWLLKCKPNCWRLYFYVNEREGRITYLHAVCKKKDQEDPTEAQRAKQRLDQIGRRESSITLFAFPAS